jgi:hypothetical protein
MPLEAEAIGAMTQALRRMEAMVAPPERVRHQTSFVFRYANKGIHEAILQKLARSTSGLNAVFVLLHTGFVQEAGVLFRTLDEIQEDIMFLATAETNNARTDRHDKYLEAFYADPVFSRPEGSLNIPKPNLLPRKKIRAHTVNVLGEGVNVSQALAAGEAVGTAYSGYVHASSECIMDMYGGDPPHFHVAGMRGTPRIATFVREAETYVYRGLMATIAAAKAFGDASLVEALYQFMGKYESANGHVPPKKKEA